MERKVKRSTRVSELTVEELQILIMETVRLTVQDAVQEFLAEASYNAEMTMRAEVTDYLRASLNGNVPGMFPDEDAPGWELDD